MRAGIRSFLRDRVEGVAAVEFALVAPLLIAIFIPMVDLGLYLNLKFKLNSAVSAATNYALVNTANVNSTSGLALGSSLVSIVLAAATVNSSDKTVVVVNNGLTITSVGSVVSSQGTASNADSCYCPTLSSGSLVWGTATTCGATCASGGIAGKFISISATKTYTHLFDYAGLLTSSSVTTSVILETS